MGEHGRGSSSAFSGAAPAGCHPCPPAGLAADIARAHHERWDGTGYPDHLKGDEIPLCARLVAIADVFDALTSERPYKRAWAPDEAVAEILKGRGTHFTPELVDCFIAVLPRVLELRDRLSAP